MTAERAMTDDRGVSEVLGFIFIFAIIVGSVGILYVSGVGSLTGARNAEQSHNAQRAFSALATTFDDLQRGRAPARAGEIRLSGGSLSVENGTTLRVAINQTSPSAIELNRTLSHGSLVYSYDGKTVRYEAGGVFSRSDGGSVTIRSPAFSCSPDRAFVSATSVDRGGGATAVSKQGSVLVVGRTASTELVFPTNAKPQDGMRKTTVTVTVVSSPNEAAWRRYLEANGWEKTGSGYQCHTRQAFVRETTVVFSIRS